MNVLKIERAIAGLIEWREHVQPNSNIEKNIDDAIEALEKQMPMEQGSREMDYAGRARPTCGNCGEAIEDAMWEFCPWCGQKIGDATE